MHVKINVELKSTLTIEHTLQYIFVVGNLRDIYGLICPRFNVSIMRAK